MRLLLAFGCAVTLLVPQAALAKGNAEAEAQRVVGTRRGKAWSRPAGAARVAPIVQPTTTTVRKSDDDAEAPAHLRIKDLTSIGDIFLVAGSKLQVRARARVN